MYTKMRVINMANENIIQKIVSANDQKPSVFIVYSIRKLTGAVLLSNPPIKSYAFLVVYLICK